MDIKADLFEGGFEIRADFLSENVGVGEVVGFFEAFLASRSIGSRWMVGEISIMSPESYEWPWPWLGPEPRGRDGDNHQLEAPNRRLKADLDL